MITEPHLKTRSLKILTEKLKELGVTDGGSLNHTPYTIPIANIKMYEDKRMPKGVVYLVDKGFIIKTFHI